MSRLSAKPRICVIGITGTPARQKVSPDACAVDNNHLSEAFSSQPPPIKRYDEQSGCHASSIDGLSLVERKHGSKMRCALAAVRTTTKVLPSAKRVLLLSSDWHQSHLCDTLLQLRLPLGSLYGVEVRPAAWLQQQAGEPPSTHRRLFQTFFHREPHGAVKPPLSPMKFAGNLEYTIAALAQVNAAPETVLEWARAHGHEPFAMPIAETYCRFVEWAEQHGAPIADGTLAAKNAASRLLPQGFDQIVVSDAHALTLSQLLLLVRAFPSSASVAGNENVGDVRLFADADEEAGWTGSGRRIPSQLLRAIAGGTVGVETATGEVVGARTLEGAPRSAGFAWHFDVAAELPAGDKDSEPFAEVGGAANSPSPEQRLGHAVAPPARARSAVVEPDASGANVAELVDGVSSGAAGVSTFSMSVPAHSGADTEATVELLAQAFAREGDGFQACSDDTRGFATAAGAQLRSKLRSARSIGVVCKSAAHARRLHDALQASALGSSHPGGAPVDVVCHTGSALSAVPRVRALMTFLSLAVGTATDSDALFAVLTSPCYGMAHSAFQRLLHLSASRHASPGTPHLTDADAVLRRLQDMAACEAEAQPARQDVAGKSPLGPAGQLAQDLEMCRRELDKRGSVAAAAARYCRKAPWLQQLSAEQSHGAAVQQAAVAAVLNLFFQLERPPVSLVVSGDDASGSVAVEEDGGAGDLDAAFASASALAHLPRTYTLPPTATSGSAPDLHVASATSAGGSSGASIFTPERLAPATVLRIALQRIYADKLHLAAGSGGSDGADAAFELDEELWSPDISTMAAALQGTSEAEGEAEPAVAAAGTQPQPVSGSPRRCLIVITTMARALQHRYDTVLFPWLTDATLPGSFMSPRLPFPATPFKHSAASLLAAAGMVGSHTPPSADIAEAAEQHLLHPFPLTRGEHVEAARARFRALCQRARDCVVVVEPAQPSKRPRGLSRVECRCRFVEELATADAGPPSRSARVAGARKGASSGEASTANPSPTAADAPASARHDPPVPAPALAPGAEAMVVPSGPLLLSLSRVSEYMWCPYRFYLGRVLGLRGTSSPALTYGKALHAAAAAVGDGLLAWSRLCGGESESRELEPPLPPFPAEGVFRQRDAQRCASATEVAHRLAGGDVALAQRMLAGLPQLRAQLERGGLAAYADAWLHPDASHPFGGAAASAPAADARLPASQQQELDDAAAAGVRRYLAAEMEQLRASLLSVGRLGDGSGDPARAGCASIHLPVMVEAPFELHLPAEGALQGVLPPQGAQLRGVIDRVDVRLATPGGVLDTPPCAHSTLVVREFKSGAQWRENGQLQTSGGRSLQLDLYGAVVRSSLVPLVAPTLQSVQPGARPVVAAGVSNGSIAVQAQLESLETGEVVVATTTPASSAVGNEIGERFGRALHAAAGGILRREYRAQPGQTKCGYCPFRATCEHAAV